MVAGAAGMVTAGCCGVARMVGDINAAVALVGVAAVEAAAVVAVGGVGKTSSSLAALPAPTRVGLSAQWLFTHSAVDWPTTAKCVVP